MINPSLIERVAVTQATRDAFARPFEWGIADCLTMAHAHLSAFGYMLPTIPRYRTAQGARSALKRQSALSLADLLDRNLVRIAPAAALVGDLILLEGEKPFDALMIKMDSKCFGWHEDYEGLVNFTPEQFVAAFSVGVPL
jgi:hypothetical protein